MTGAEGPCSGAHSPKWKGGCGDALFIHAAPPYLRRNEISISYANQCAGGVRNETQTRERSGRRPWSFSSSLAMPARRRLTSSASWVHHGGRIAVCVPCPPHIPTLPRMSDTGPTCYSSFDLSSIYTVKYHLTTHICLYQLPFLISTTPGPRSRFPALSDLPVI